MLLVKITNNKKKQNAKQNTDVTVTAKQNNISTW